MLRVRPVGRRRIVASTRTGLPVTAVAFAPGRFFSAARPTLSLAVSTNGRWVAYGQIDGSVVLEGSAGAGRRVLRTGDAPVTAVAFSPDTTQVATGGGDGAVQIRDLASGKEVRSFVGHKLGVTSASFSPDGSRLLTTSLDHEARTWSLASGRLEHVLGLHFGPVAGASWSRDGQWVVTAGSSAASVISADTGQRILILRGPSRPLVGAAFAGSDGRLIVTASKDGTIRDYRCDLCGGIDDLIALAKRRLRSR
jgi:WD40 repeat protein